jgi:hypothetical protein
MENTEVTWLKQVVSELPPHLPALWAVYQKSTADVYFQDALGRDATDEEWQEIYAKFSEESDNVWGALAEVFSECIDAVIPEEVCDECGLVHDNDYTEEDH